MKPIFANAKVLSGIKPNLEEEEFHPSGSWCIFFNFSMEDPSIFDVLTLLSDNQEKIAKLDVLCLGSTNASIKDIKDFVQTVPCSFPIVKADPGFIAWKSLLIVDPEGEYTLYPGDLMSFANLYQFIKALIQARLDKLEASGGQGPPPPGGPPGPGSTGGSSPIMVNISVNYLNELIEGRSKADRKLNKLGLKYENKKTENRYLKARIEKLARNNAKARVKLYRANKKPRQINNFGDVSLVKNKK